MDTAHGHTKKVAEIIKYIKPGPQKVRKYISSLDFILFSIADYVTWYFVNTRVLKENLLLKLQAFY